MMCFCGERERRNAGGGSEKRNVCDCFCVCQWGISVRRIVKAIHFLNSIILFFGVYYECSITVLYEMKPIADLKVGANF